MEKNRDNPACLVKLAGCERDVNIAMRIVHVITNLDTGGAEMMLKKLVSETLQTIDHVVISLRGIGPVGKSLQDLGIPVIGLSGRPGSSPVFLLRRLIKELRMAKPDLVQAWMYHGNFAAWAAKKFGGKKWPLYWSVRGAVGKPGNLKSTTRIINKTCALLSGSVECIIYNSHLARREHEEIGYASTKGLVIPNGFDTERFSPSSEAREDFRQRHAIPDNRLIVGHIARAHPMKDQASLLTAAVGVMQQAPDAIFVLAGPGMPALAQTQPRTAALIAGLRSRVLLLPEQQNTNRLMAAFDIFVLSSAFGEGFPNVLGEALSCGVPCVATDVGDSAEVVGNSGIIVPPKEPNMLAEAILKLLRTPEAVRHGLGLAGRKRMQEHYALSRIAKTYAACWNGSTQSFCPEGLPCAE